MNTMNNRTILDLNNKEARKLLIKPKNYCNLSLPKYFDFKPILDFVKSTVGGKSMDSCLATNISKSKKKIWPSNFDDVNYKFLVNKDGRYAFRPFQIINPYYYYFFVCLLTKKSNWSQIITRFSQFYDSHIDVVSMPCIPKAHANEVATAINNWYTDFEQQSIEYSLDYKYMFITDITSCYGSIYTHSIAWAMHGKQVAKQHIGDHNLLGNQIDDFMQHMQFNQSNGIPQGNMVSDFVAELVLGYADKLLADKLANKGINEYKVLRYRDDYRIFSNNKIELEKIALTLQEVLSGLNFQINSSKTKFSESIIFDSIKQDKLYYQSVLPLYKNQDKSVVSAINSAEGQLFYILQFSKKYPNSPTVQKLLTKFYAWYAANQNMENIIVLTAILVDIIMDNPRSFQVGTAILSSFISNLHTSKEQADLLNRMYKRLSELPDQGVLQLWLQRITTKINIKVLMYTEKLCRIVEGQPDVQIWNNTWLDSRYTSGFPLHLMLNNTILQSLQPTMGLNEFDVFEY
ncbi:RNA-directed DNA polymerase [Segatella asaccharophila]